MTKSCFRLGGSKAVLKLLIVSVLVCAGCSIDSSTFEQNLLLVAQQQGELFELPNRTSTSDAWDSLMILCPYATLSAETPTNFQDAAKRIDAATTDASQWLMFESNGVVEVDILSRDIVDFCAATAHGDRVYKSTEKWSSQTINGTTQLMPALPSGS